MKKIKQDAKSYAKEMGVRLPRKRRKDKVMDIIEREEDEYDPDTDA